MSSLDVITKKIVRAEIEEMMLVTKGKEKYSGKICMNAIKLMSDEFLRIMSTATGKLLIYRFKLYLLSFSRLTILALTARNS